MPTSTPRLHALSTHLLTLSTPSHSGPTGINCTGEGCNYENLSRYSQAFADVLSGKAQPTNGSPPNPGLGDDAEIHDGQQLACFANEYGLDGLCAFVYGLGDATTMGANLKLVAQDLANHCGECGQAPVNRVGNHLSGGWYQVQRTPTKDICHTMGGQLALC